MSPEQIDGGPLDHRADLYAVGSMLFELVTGRVPFSNAPTLGALLATVARTAPPVPSEVTRIPGAVREQLDALVRCCLAKKPEHRPGSAREISMAMGEMVARLSATQAVDSEVGQLLAGRPTRASLGLPTSAPDRERPRQHV